MTRKQRLNLPPRLLEQRVFRPNTDPNRFDRRAGGTVTTPGIDAVAYSTDN